MSAGLPIYIIWWQVRLWERVSRWSKLGVFPTIYNIYVTVSVTQTHTEMGLRLWTDFYVSCLKTRNCVSVFILGYKIKKNWNLMPIFFQIWPKGLKWGGSKHYQSLIKVE